ncbi:DUF805 domain-containing protein [Caldimonas sp. KR1-144]|uniref:DUF805 domain-containing protein n=1 Tax=Caldimonas sp. KR1-144 TaxID=3400911 RepID=UPI003C07730F
MRIVDEFKTAGRLSRAGFWLRHALALPVLLFLCIAADAHAGRALGLLLAAATTLFLVSVWGRRLHDRARSAWWLLLAAVPVAGAVFLMIDCGLLGPRPGAERFGPAPGRVPTDYLRVQQSKEAA